MYSTQLQYHNKNITIGSMTQQILDCYMSCLVKIEDSREDIKHVRGMSSKYSKSWNWVRKELLIVPFSCTCLLCEGLIHYLKMHVKWKIDLWWFLCKGSVEPEFRCQDRMCYCLCSQWLFAMSRICPGQWTIQDIITN